MNINKKIQFATESDVVTPPPITTEFALRSDSNTSNPEVGSPCSFALDEACYIGTQSTGVLTVGDIVYTVSGGPFVFPGNGNYYIIQFQAGLFTTYVASINGSGEITNIYGTCPL